MQTPAPDDKATPAAAAPAATPAPAPTAKEVKPDTDTKPGYWPDNWRETVSKDDAKKLSRLQRYASPEAALDALIAAQNRISQGELKPALGKNPTAEQLKEWREAHGIPETPDKYDLGEAAASVPKELLDNLLAEAHATNQTPDQVKATLKAWAGIQTKVAEQRAERDYEIQTQGEESLRQEWGPEFRRNINMIHGLLDGAATPELKEQILGGRLADGTPIGSSPEMLRFLVGLALINNPVATVVPNASANPMQGTEDEISRIEKIMREDRASYNKDEKMQARLRDLYEAREKLQQRKAA